MKDLIERLEKATGPSRVLDGMIFKAVFQKPGDDWYDGFSDGVWHRRDPDDSCAFDAPEAYTSSIDAALTLVPAGCAIQIIQAFGPDRTDWYAHCKERDESGSKPCFKGNAHNGATALCIAALKARQRSPAETKGVSE